MLRRLAAAGLSQRTDAARTCGSSRCSRSAPCCSSRRVQGKVWYTAQVVGVVLALVYAWASIEAKRPLVAGLALGAAALTRTPMAFMLPLFVFELWRMPARRARRRVALLVSFAIPIVGFAIAGMIYNAVRFHSPTEFGHTYLDVRQQIADRAATASRAITTSRATSRSRSRCCPSSPATRPGSRSAATASRSGSPRRCCSTPCGRARSRRSIARCGSPSRASRSPSLFYMNSRLGPVRLPVQPRLHRVPDHAARDRRAAARARKPLIVACIVDQPVRRVHVRSRVAVLPVRRQRLRRGRGTLTA